MHARARASPPDWDAIHVRNRSALFVAWTRWQPRIDMYQELVGGLLLRGHEQERERFQKRLHRLRELESGAATGPGWRSPAAVVEREREPGPECSHEPSFWQWALAMRLAGAKS